MLRSLFSRKFVASVASTAGMRRILRTATLAAVAIASLAAAGAARASVTIGQLAPGSPPASICNTGPVDLFNPTTGGNSYVIPGTGTITSWSTSAGPGAGQMLKMKIFRKVTDPMDYRVVGHDLRALTAGTINTFPVSIPVQAGDVLGLNDANANMVSNACDFDASPATRFALVGDLADNQTGTFSFDANNVRDNVTAVFEATPSNTPPPTGQRAAALKNCKKKLRHNKAKRKTCKRKANLLPF